MIRAPSTSDVIGQAQPGHSGEPLPDLVVQACVERRQPVGAGAAEDVVRSLLDRPDRASFVYLSGDWPVGHATLLCDSHDDLTGRAFVELVDVLVEPSDNYAVAMRELVGAGVRQTRRIGLPLIGSVVHPADDTTTGHGDRVLASLQRSGWAVDHVYWSRPLPRLEPRP